MGLNETLYMKLEDGTKVAPTWDERQVGEDRPSSVQYVKFNTGGAVPVAIGCDFPDEEVNGETQLTDEQKRALASDIRE